MDVLWKEGDVPVKHVADVLTKELGWNKNSSYTLIKHCIKRELLNALNLILYVVHLFPKKKYRKPKRMN